MPRQPDWDAVEVKASEAAAHRANREHISQAELDTQYNRSVSAFWCPVCKSTYQRPDADTLGKEREAWRFRCDNPECFARGTRAEIEMAAMYKRLYAKRIEPMTPIKRCPECACEVGQCEHTAPYESADAEHIRNGQA